MRSDESTPYELVFSEVAEADFESFQPLTFVHIAAHLDLLAAHPVRLSRPSLCPPYWPNHQMYEFSIMADNQLYYCVVLFKYMDNEQQLWVGGLGCRPGDLDVFEDD